MAASWEVWLDKSNTDLFTQGVHTFGVAIGQERLEFPEDIVVVAYGTRAALAQAIKQIGGVKALAAPSITAEFFASMDVQEQAQWTADLQQRTSFPPRPDPGYVTLLDTGVNRAHPLVQPALEVADRHASNVAWSVEDLSGHGTQMAGLALYGDLVSWKAHGRAAPFKCNDEMLDDKFAASGVVLFGGNGVALNLGQKAEDKGITVMRIADSASSKAEATQ